MATPSACDLLITCDDLGRGLSSVLAGEVRAVSARTLGDRLVLRLTDVTLPLGTLTVELALGVESAGPERLRLEVDVRPTSWSAPLLVATQLVFGRKLITWLVERLGIADAVEDIARDALTIDLRRVRIGPFPLRELVAVRSIAIDAAGLACAFAIPSPAALPPGA